MSTPDGNPDAKLWQSRIKRGDEHYEEWEKRFQVKILVDYYEGFHFNVANPLHPDAPYVVNKVQTNVEAAKPSVLSRVPFHRVVPIPGLEDDLSLLEQPIKLMQATLQTMVEKRSLHFLDHVSMAHHNSFFGPGLVEVGFSKRFVDNPNAGKPIMVADKDGGEQPKRDEKGEPVLEPPFLNEVAEEKLYFRSIPFETFRVNANSTGVLEENDWCGYYEIFTLKEVLQAFPKTDVRRYEVFSGETIKQSVGDLEPSALVGTRVKVWKIWDLSARKKVRICGQEYLGEEPFDFLPVVDLKYLPWRNFWWPVPPTYSWIGPQRGINYARTLLQRVVRQSIPKYVGRKRGFDPDELERVLRSEDVEVAWTEEELDDIRTAVALLETPRMGLDFHRFLAVLDDDFVESSGFAAEMRGLAESDTATQASILDARGQIREEGVRTRLSAALGRLGKATLLTIRDNFALPLVVRHNINPASPDAPIKLLEIFKTVEVLSDFPDIDFDVEVELASRNPASEQLKRISLNSLLQLLSNQVLAMVLANSPLLLRKTLEMHDMIAESEQLEVQRALQATVKAIQEAEMAKKTQGSPGNLVDQFVQSGGVQ